jgi:phosphoenolpyruvate carboxykinase (ATP)
MGGHPKNIFFLTCDAFGVLPPLSRLNEFQAMYHFLSGYTAKVAGTEQGVTEPSATFSSCFGAPFMPRHSSVYAGLLQKKLQSHHCKVWLINTGWRGGKPGVGHRYPIQVTRALLSGVLHGNFDSIPFTKDSYFGLEVPTLCPGVEKEMLNPILAWHNHEDYRANASKLSSLFEANFKKFAGKVALDVCNAGPKPL